MITENDCIKVDYKAYVKENNLMFDTTSEDAAKKAGIYNKETKYEPVKLIVGKGFVVPGVDESFIGKKAGDSYKLELSPEKGFGLRSMNNTENIKINSFKEQKIDPYKGMVVNIDGRMGTVVFVSVGRFAKVDFNHPLAGKELIYEVKILEELKEPIDILKAVTDSLLGKEGVSIDLKDNTFAINTKFEVPKQFQEIIKKTVKESLKKEYNLSFSKE